MRSLRPTEHPNSSALCSITPTCRATAGVRKKSQGSGPAAVQWPTRMTAVLRLAWAVPILVVPSGLVLTTERASCCLVLESTHTTPVS